MTHRPDPERIIKECEWAIARIEDYGSTTMTSRLFFADVAKLLKEQDELINELLELGYPHNFQHEAPWVVDYLYKLTEIIKKAFKAKEGR